MAKRKRLTPARSDYLTGGAAQPDETPADLETKSMFPMGGARHTPPIAQVAKDAAMEAAVQDLSNELKAAREEGRMIIDLPLEAVDEGHLVRDRILADEEEMEVLIESLRARGQQTPIEVVGLEQGRFGLISGWRRLSALRQLHAETGEDRFATVQALLRAPESASDAYLAMVEENEIRVGLSYYERARIAARATDLGVYPDEKRALQGLFANVSRAKRSKIKSFLTIYRALDDDLSFATQIPERLGLTLAKALSDDEGVADHIRAGLRTTPPQTAAEEATLLTRLAQPEKIEDKTLNAWLETDMSRSDAVSGMKLSRNKEGTKLTLSAETIPDDLWDAVVALLRNRG